MAHNKRFTGLIAALVVSLVALASRAEAAGHNGYVQHNLVSDGISLYQATTSDPFLLNPWGIAFEPGLSFWIAVNNRGSAKVVDPAGRLRAIQHSADRHADICNLRRARRHRD